MTAHGGWALLARAAWKLGLLEPLGSAVAVERRDRGASDSEMLWSLIASLSVGNGALSDVNPLRADATSRARRTP